MKRRTFFKKSLMATTAGTIAFNAIPGNAAGSDSTPPDELNKTLLTADVLVIGAGTSGIPAAIAAARQGAKVLLIEDDPVPGGAPVDMYVSNPCGGPRAGIYQEILNALEAGHNLSPFPQQIANWFLLPSSWCMVVDELIRKEPNITLLCGARVNQVLLGNEGKKRVEGVVIQRQNGVQQGLKAKVVIDATGTGEIADMAGCESMYGREARSQFNEPIGPDKADKQIQQCTWMYILHKIRPDAKLDLVNTRWVPKESGYGWLKKKDPKQVEEFFKRDTGLYLVWGGRVVCEDTRDPVAVAQAQLTALREAILRDAPHLMKCGYGMNLAPKLGVRETRRVIAEHIVTVNDLVNPQWPDDVISVGKYGIDSWGDPTAVHVEIPRYGYGIPYRSLLTKGTTNLMVVGKSASSTHLAQSAIRVQPILSQMGQAAGTAAAMAVAEGKDLRSINIDRLQDKLRSQGMLSRG